MKPGLAKSRYKTVEKAIFGLFAFIFLAAGVHHAYEYFIPTLRPDYSPVRHLVFVFLNCVLAILMIKRTKYFVPLLALMTLQQLVGHGSNLVRNLAEGEPTIYTDWLVVIFAPIVLVIYSYDVLLNSKLKN